jgi:Protein of unknown function (DUF2937)
MPLMRDLLLVLLVGAGAVGGSQLPSFVQQYEQRLGGARQEATRQLERFRLLASGQGLDLDSYAARLAANPDSLVVRTGEAVVELRRRVAVLDRHAQELAAAAWLRRPLVVLAAADHELLEGTWRTFRPTLALDPTFGAVGAIGGWLVRWLLAAGIGLAVFGRPARKSG